MKSLPFAAFWVLLAVLPLGMRRGRTINLLAFMQIRHAKYFFGNRKNAARSNETCPIFFFLKTLKTLQVKCWKYHSSKPLLCLCVLLWVPTPACVSQQVPAAMSNTCCLCSWSLFFHKTFCCDWLTPMMPVVRAWVLRLKPGLKLLCQPVQVAVLFLKSNAHACHGCPPQLLHRFRSRSCIE